MKGNKADATNLRSSAATISGNKSKDALWIVFDHRTVLPEYIVEFDLLPVATDAQQTPKGQVDASAYEELRSNTSQSQFGAKPAGVTGSSQILGMAQA